MEVRVTCPLGSKCEEVKVQDGKGYIERCAWYIGIKGIDPNTGKDLDESRCSMAWQPILMIDVAGKTSGVGAAVESFRNETVEINKGINKGISERLSQGMGQGSKMINQGIGEGYVGSGITISKS